MAGEPKKKNIRNTVAKKGGRPEIEIDFNMVKSLCGIQCTGEEIASILNISYDTLQKRIVDKFNESFSEYFKKASAGGKASLRRSQFKLAEKSPAMSIWLGKQYLGQREPDNNLQNEQLAIPEFETMTDEQLQRIIDAE